MSHPRTKENWFTQSNYPPTRPLVDYEEKYEQGRYASRDLPPELRFRLVNIAELTLDNTTLWVENMLPLSSPSEPENTADIDYTTILAGFRNLRRLTTCMRPRMRTCDVHRTHSKESILIETRP